nr:condensation domain-containing protein [Bacillus velezensis]
MSKKSIQKVYALTPMQEGMLYHAPLDPHSSSYFTQLELRIHGSFQLELFEKSVNELIRTYDILRTVFVHQRLQKPRQVVLAERKTKVHYEDISQLDEARQTEYIERYKRGVRRQRAFIWRRIFSLKRRCSDSVRRSCISSGAIIISSWTAGVWAF